MRVRFLILLAVALTIACISHTSFAQCYTRAQAEADQGLRIQSELMVIGLNCQDIGARHGMTPYQDYRKFSQTHSNLIQKYELLLLQFYSQNGLNQKDALNALRTNYANAISKVSAVQRPDVFCARHIGRIDKASGMSEKQLRTWASTLYPSHPVSYPLCKG